MFARLTLKVLESVGKAVKSDIGNPLTQDTLDMTFTIGKGIIKITKEVLF